MALIRQATAKTMAREAVVLDLGDLAAQGELLKTRARAEADQIVAAARAERERLLSGAAEQGRKEGFARGHEEGRRAGAEQGRREAIAASDEALRGLEEAWLGALASFEADRDRMLLEGRQEVVRVAALVAELVTKRALALDPSVVADQLGAVLAMVVRPTRLTVSVHPEDEAIVRDALPGLAAKLAGASHVEFIGDASLERGSCVARSGSGGVIDASIGTQLERIAEVLLPATNAPDERGPGEAP
ncbi:MAG: FliH/SctL family protein [Phycisphaerales bacterium]